MANFNYSITEFDLLTPVQAFEILDRKKDVEENKIDLLKAEFRLQNYFIIKSSMGETNHIKKPEDLYSLPVDELVKQYHQKKLEQYQPDQDFINWANKVLDKI